MSKDKNDNDEIKEEKEDFDATKVIPNIKDLKNIQDTASKEESTTETKEEKPEEEKTSEVEEKTESKTEVVPTITSEDIKENETKEEVPEITWNDLTDDPVPEKDSEKIVLNRPGGKRVKEPAHNIASLIKIFAAVLIILIALFTIVSVIVNKTIEEKEEEFVEGTIINDGKMTIDGNDVIGEENINLFFSNLKDTEEKISIVIETKTNGSLTQTTTLSYTPGRTNVNSLESTKVDLNEVYKDKIAAENLPAKKINLKKIDLSKIYNNKISNATNTEESEVIENVSNAITNNTVVEFDAYSAIANEYGEYELRITPTDGQEEIYTFDALNWEIKKDVSDKNIKIYLDTDLKVNFKPVICEYTSKVSDITNAIVKEDVSYCGRIYSVEKDRIYFYDKNNECFTIENTKSISFINGRTAQDIKLSQIKENDYVRTYEDGKVHIYRNLKDNALKSEILANISLAKDKSTPDFMQVDVDSIEKTADKTAIVDITVHDFVNSEFDTAAKEQTITLRVRFDKKTLYYSDTGIVNSVDSLIEAVGDINSIILDKSTINSSTPRVIEFNNKNVE